MVLGSHFSLLLPLNQNPVFLLKAVITKKNKSKHTLNRQKNTIKSCEITTCVSHDWQPWSC